MIVYLTKNLINGKKYIGKDSHNNPNYLGSGALLLEDIKKYGRENFQKEILEVCYSDEELTYQESYWITHFNATKSDSFYNLVDFSGGWNIHKLGKKKYDFICNKISISTIGIPKPWLKIDNNRKDKLRQANTGKPKPTGFGEKISIAKKGKKLSLSHCVSISQGKLGKKQPQSYLDKKYKPIQQLDQDDNIICEFKSIEDASKHNLKFKRSNISCCLIGVSKTAYGFKWVYK